MKIGPSEPRIVPAALASDVRTNTATRTDGARKSAEVSLSSMAELKLDPNGEGSFDAAKVERITQAIRDAASGASTLDPRATGALLSQFRELSAKQAEAELAGLTDRERRMLALIAEGYTNRAIGEVLHLSEKTVRNHVSQLLRKLGFQRRSQAAAWAGERRLELPPE